MLLQLFVLWCQPAPQKTHFGRTLRQITSSSILHTQSRGRYYFSLRSSRRGLSTTWIACMSIMPLVLTWQALWSIQLNSVAPISRQTSHPSIYAWPVYGRWPHYLVDPQWFYTDRCVYRTSVRKVGNLRPLAYDHMSENRVSGGRWRWLSINRSGADSCKGAFWWWNLLKRFCYALNRRLLLSLFYSQICPNWRWLFCL